jgi:UDP-glucose 4-epimerase
MKKILICGAGSYIGGSFEQYMAPFGDEYSIDTLDMQDASWREHSFSGYDCVYLVAGIAHRKETKENAHLYYEVNRDLAIEVAKRAKDAGVSQLIFLSSMSVYGIERGVITPDTTPAPKSNYGRSKLEAERGMDSLASENFKICTLRPPMVYGKGCRGNFGTVVALVRKLPFFPKVNNRRSMIYIDNLSLFVKIAIDRGLSGLYFPQNREYINTSVMASIIAERLDKKCPLSAFMGLGAKMAIPFLSIAKKAFGTLIYEGTETLDFEYAAVSAEEGVRRSV